MNFYQTVSHLLSLFLSNPFVQLLDTIFVFIAALFSCRNLIRTKRLESFATYQKELLRVHYQEKLSCVKDFLTSAGAFIADPSNDDLYNDMVTKSGIAVYVSNQESMSAIESFLQYAKIAKSGKENLIEAENAYHTLSVLLGQESVQMSTKLKE